MPDTYFSIPVLLPDTDVVTFLSIHDTGEIFETELLGEPISLIKNEDNSLSQLKGDTPQETIDIIVQAIEDLQLKRKG
ncbi:MAG TPA: hypothetical protein DIT07_10580 [Sphingobacteriaceae bacterium]|nr:hypothetical protein [Sphingobacteriaceae bacterium]